jgi:hypothetical protein
MYVKNLFVEILLSIQIIYCASGLQQEDGSSFTICIVTPSLKNGSLRAICSSLSTIVITCGWSAGSNFHIKNSP